MADEIETNGADAPEMAPIREMSESSLRISHIEGPCLSLWSAHTQVAGETARDFSLRLQPNEVVVIGRQEGGRIEYLDDRYRPTQILPTTGERIVTLSGDDADRSVSRGHFMLRGAGGVILFVNGVPRRGGGIRPPVNGTEMLEPESRHMVAGEEFRIERGFGLRVRLPNLTVLLLRAE